MAFLSRFPRQRIPYVILAGLFVAIWIFLLPTRLAVPLEETYRDDASEYHRGAIHLLHDGLYSLDGIAPTSEREPGYSIFLALVYAIGGDGNRVVLFGIQALLHLAAVFVFLREYRPLFGKRASVICCGFLLLTPSVFHIIDAPLRESLSLSLLLFAMASILAWMRTKKWVFAPLSGALSGMLLLVYLPLFPVCFVLLGSCFFLRVSKTQVIVAMGICAVFLGGLMMRNAAVSPSCLLGGCARGDVAWYTRGQQVKELSFTEPPKCLWAQYVTRNWEGRAPACRFGMGLYDLLPGSLSDHEVELAAIAKEARMELLRHPFKHLWISFVWAIEFHFPYVNGWGFSYNLLETIAAATLYVGFLFLPKASWRREWIVLLVPIVAGTVLFALIDVEPRYRMPLFGAYAAVGSIGYASLGRKRS